jgi:hypothetical protein
MTLLAPPLKVEHKVSKDEDTMVISAYLVTYNEKGMIGLPPGHEKIWGAATTATENQLKKCAAKRMLGDMFVEGLPISQTFLKQLGPQFADSDPEWSGQESEDELGMDSPGRVTRGKGRDRGRVVAVVCRGESGVRGRR